MHHTAQPSGELPASPPLVEIGALPAVPSSESTSAPSDGLRGAASVGAAAGVAQRTGTGGLVGGHPGPPSDPSNDLPTEPAALPASSIADGSERRLEPSSIQADALSWWILVGVVAVGGLVGLLVLGIAIGEALAWLLGLAAWIVLVGASILGALRWPRLAWRHASYVVRPSGIEIRHGVLWRRITSVPRSRVQHIDVVQGPVLRRYGLATLAIHTAGTEEAVVGLSGLSMATATAIRDVLLGDAPSPSTSAQRGRDGV